MKLLNAANFNQWDTAGRETYDGRKNLRNFGIPYRGTHGVIILYDVTNKSSFENAKNW